jgi:hypothetical protein
MSTKESKFPMRLKDDGTELANFYNKLALKTIGEQQWEAMKTGKLNWSMIEDIYFRTAELLGEQLETIPKSELLEKTSETPIKK